MIFRRIAMVSTLALLVFTCASCQTADLDQDGDGIVTKQEFLAAALDQLCDDDSDSEEPTDEEPTDEEPTQESTEND